ncbi:hypothetical protein M3Y98_00239800 [Aphelenchoides besseyi]|nr:hypothetical protein M3Y98_00239800 [Aphelenchoides besseyi]
MKVLYFTVVFLLFDFVTPRILPIDPHGRWIGESQKHFESASISINVSTDSPVIVGNVTKVQNVSDLPTTTELSHPETSDSPIGNSSQFPGNYTIEPPPFNSTELPIYSTQSSLNSTEWYYQTSTEEPSNSTYDPRNSTLGPSNSTELPQQRSNDSLTYNTALLKSTQQGNSTDAQSPINSGFAGNTERPSNYSSDKAPTGLTIAEENAPSLKQMLEIVLLNRFNNSEATTNAESPYKVQVNSSVVLTVQ